MSRPADDTLPKLLRTRARLEPGRIAMRRKKYGIWNTYTYETYYGLVSDFALGLMALGLERGDAVCVIGESDPEWYWSELACQAAGGHAVGIFTDCAVEEVLFYVSHSEATFVVAHDQEQVDKVLGLLDRLPKVKKVIYWEPKGLWFYDHPQLLGFNDVVALGNAEARRSPKRLDESIDSGSGEDIAIICYTSGTTGQPKGAMISHRNSIETCQAWHAVDARLPEDEYLSFISPAWVAEQNLGITSSLLFNFRVNFPEEPDTAQQNIREIGPRFIMFSGRMWESVCATIQARMDDATGPKKWAYDLILPVAIRAARKSMGGEQAGIGDRIGRIAIDFLLARGLRDKIGLSKIRFAYTAGAALSPEILVFFRAIGVNLKQFYGSTEAGLVTIHYNGDVQSESVGVVAPGAEVRISGRGEVLVRGVGVFRGYFRNPEATRKVLDDGWFRTGDGGVLREDGHLIYIDRISDFRDLSGGRYFSPNFIEVRLRFSRYIQECMAVGGADREFVVCLVSIDFQNTGSWAEKRGIGYTTFQDLSQKEEVAGLISREIRQINAVLPEESRIWKFVVLHKEFDPDEAELTRTRKLRRAYVENRYRDVIDAAFSGAATVPMETEVTYQDGRVRKMQIGLHVRTVG